MQRSGRRVHQRCISLTLEEDEAARALVKLRLLSKVCGKAIVEYAKEHELLNSIPK